jgi:hypothetical protein
VTLECSRIGFQRDLGVGQQRNARANAGEQTVDRGGGKQARRAAAKENGRDLASPDAGQRELEIGQQRVDVRVLRHVAARLVRIEVAIRAFAHAPRDVRVQRERRQHVEVRACKARGVDCREISHVFNYRNA